MSMGFCNRAAIAQMTWMRPVAKKYGEVACPDEYHEDDMDACTGQYNENA
jgi:hypothetical protein